MPVSDGLGDVERRGDRDGGVGGVAACAQDADARPRSRRVWLDATMPRPASRERGGAQTAAAANRAGGRGCPGHRKERPPCEHGIRRGAYSCPAAQRRLQGLARTFSRYWPWTLPGGS